MNLSYPCLFLYAAIFAWKLYMYTWACQFWVVGECDGLLHSGYAPVHMWSEWIVQFSVPLTFSDAILAYFHSMETPLSWPNPVTMVPRWDDNPLQLLVSLVSSKSSGVRSPSTSLDRAGTFLLQCSICKRLRGNSCNLGDAPWLRASLSTSQMSCNK